MSLCNFLQCSQLIVSNEDECWAEGNSEDAENARGGNKHGARRRAPAGRRLVADLPLFCLVSYVQLGDPIIVFEHFAPPLEYPN